MQTSNESEALPDFQSLIQKYIDFRKQTWSDSTTKSSWWKFWQSQKVILMTKFLIETVDELVPYFNQFLEMEGVAKKALVMLAMGQLYDYLAAQCLPVWLKPVSIMLRTLVLEQVISPLIDWAVSKSKTLILPQGSIYMKTLTLPGT